jgi:predicted dehydrogenase
MSGPPSASWQVAVVGLGWIAERVHLPYFASADATTVVGAFDVHEGRAIELCERFRVARLTSLDEILGSPAEVIAICTPPNTHVGLVLAALAAGKHVICEKPLATSAADARAIAAAAEAARRHVFCCMTNRFREDVVTMQSEIQKGAIGEPRFARATWVRADGTPGSFGALENGVIWDLGAHMIDALLWVTAWTRPAEVRSCAFRVSGPTRTKPASWYRNVVPQDMLDDIADTAMLNVRLAGGQVACVDLSWSAQVPDDRTELVVSGTEGALRLATVFGWSDSRARVEEPALAIADRRRRSWVPLVLQERGQREYRAQFDYFFSKLAAAPSGASWGELPIDTIEILERAAAYAQRATQTLAADG